MLVIVSIIVIVALFSLVDYFSSRSWQRVTSEIRNETVFEKRNKAYGAYVIRRDYDRNLVLIMLSLVCGTGLLFAAYNGFKKPVQATKVITYPPRIEDTTVLILDEIEPPKPEVPEKTEVKPETNQAQFVEMKVVDSRVNDSVLAQEKLNDQQIGTITVRKIIPNDFKLVGETKNVQTIVTNPKREVYGNVEEEAFFPGGYPALMSYIQSNLVYPSEGIEINAQGKCYLRFIVDFEGRISSVKVLRGIAGCPECDKEAIRVLKGMPEWKPGKVGGMSVSSYFDLPINFSLSY
jgi:periplasmic protein TonB